MLYEVDKWRKFCRLSEDHKVDGGDIANDEDGDDKVYFFCTVL